MEENQNKIIDITKDVFTRLGFDGEVKFLKDQNNDKKFPVLAIESTQDLSILIGKNGQNLSALEHVVKIIALRKLRSEGPEENKICNFILDINDYRSSKANYIAEVAREVAKRVMQTQRPEAMPPMSSYERRIVHTELTLFKEVNTESIGQEPRRRIVVKPQLITN